MEKKKFHDPNIDRKSKIYDDSFVQLKNGTPLPAIIEISNSGTCNRKCSFCPRSDPDYKHVNEFFPNDLHDRLCEELSEFNFKGIFAYSGFNEPLLKKDIARDIKAVRKFLPTSKIEIVTNGDVLNHKRLEKLFEAGLTTILISVYDGKEQEEKFYKMCKDLNLKDSSYIIRNRYMPEHLDFGITLSNRAGNLSNTEYKVSSPREPLKQNCTYPSYMFFVDYNGDVLMCSHDWGKKLVLGNLNKENFINIWNSKKSLIARKKLNNANRSFAPCDICDVAGSFMGNKHANAWKKISN